ncbi:hypothetical protein G3O06_04870 [Burkholderia sp. Ac-20345]|uniref:hypothetical protein n=1 Tax=Burkholderia sp. Ac-20345 TaxID=2703891 RepID=UPI00197C8EAB|nr:hypothetical protein [Burkholderia sp. Ac-20345]MBN3776903.1 hypothetical protein [Burkholderia sp. Ac-20345]
MASDRGYDFDAAYVLVDLLQRVEPGAVTGALLAEARAISSGSSELAMLEQSDCLTRIARSLMDEKVQERIKDLREQSGRVHDHEQALESTCGKIETAAGVVWAILIRLSEVTQFGGSNAIPRAMPRNFETSRFDLDRLLAVSKPYAEWSPETQDYLLNGLAADLAAYRELFDAFTGGEEYVEKFELIVRPGQLYRLIELNDSRGELHAKAEQLIKSLDALKKEMAGIRDLGPHVDHWWRDFLNGLRGVLVAGELSQGLAPFVQPMKKLEVGTMIQVSNRLLSDDQQVIPRHEATAAPAG